MAIAIIIIYGCFLLFIFLYSLVQLNLAMSYKKGCKKLNNILPPTILTDKLPMVTVQLPVYNELYVVERLISTIVNLDYPKDKIEIQVLDDSTDESFEIAANQIKKLQAEGINIKHIVRENRIGYKAGALAYGLEIAQGEFIAIFDADFIPHEDFLLKTIPYFYLNEKVGVVQTKWEHLNEEYSLLTKLQAFGLDAHFHIEQVGRNSQGHFINFNGTAGVWRKDCIYDAGGWQSDTITEDLDLSYRAQLKGWEFVYRQEIGSPAELPAEMNALKSQQFRWTKGAAECMVKNLPKVLRKKGLGLSTKIHAIFHLMNSFIFICVLSTAILSVPILFIKDKHPEYAQLFNIATFFLFSLLILGFFYWVSRPKDDKNRLSTFLKRFPLFLSMSMGMSLHNAIAVAEGYLGKKTAFIRTPKFALQTNTGTWQGKKYQTIKVSPLTFLEGFLTLYFIGGLALGIYLNDYGLFPFHVMLVFGFGYVFLYSFKHTST